jgi:hypothetical protein
VEVWIGDVAGTETQCGGLIADYNTYTEVPCNKVGNKIIVKRPGTSITLAMAGISILSDCNCSLSSFDPLQFSSVTSYSINGLSTGSVKSIIVMPDTVSSVCGLADGITYCPHIVSFINKGTGLSVTFPYNGFGWNAATSVLTLNPALALPSCVLTATV